METGPDRKEAVPCTGSGSSSSAQSRLLLLPFASLGLACTRVEIADAAGRVIADCRPMLAEGDAGRKLEEAGAVVAITSDGERYWCRWANGAVEFQGALVIRYFAGDNLLEIVEVPDSGPSVRHAATADLRMNTVAREDRHIHRSPEGRVVGMEWYRYNADGWLLSSERLNLPEGGFTTHVDVDGTSVTRGWPGKLPFSAVSEVTRVCLTGDDGRVRADCRPITEREAIAEYERSRGFEWPDSVAISRDGQWYRCHWSQELTVGETLSIQMFAGDALVRTVQEVVACAPEEITQWSRTYAPESLCEEEPE